MYGSNDARFQELDSEYVELCTARDEDGTVMVFGGFIRPYYRFSESIAGDAAYAISIDRPVAIRVARDP